MKSPDVSGGAQQAADFADMQSAAIALEVFALRQQNKAGELSVQELSNVLVPHSLGKAVLTFVPSDAELFVVTAEPKCLHTVVHSLVLREGEPYRYTKDAQDVDVQMLPPARKTVIGIHDIAADREARRIFLHMADSIEVLGNKTLGTVRHHLSKAALQDMRQEARTYSRTRYF